MSATVLFGSRRVLAAGLAAAALALGVVFVSPALATTPGVSVTPSHGLGENEFVRVAWHGYQPGQVLLFRQCTASPADLGTDCTTTTGYDTAVSNSSGAGALYEEIRTGQILASDGTSTFQCDNADPCSFGVFTDVTLASGTFTPLTFARTPDSCPAPTATAVTGAGADEANRAMFSWTVQACQPPSSLTVSWLSQNSIDGAQNFVNGLADFAVTGIPLPSTFRSELDQKRRTFAYAPISESALVLAYKIFSLRPNGEQGAQITNLKLTPSLVAQIFTGRMSNWQRSPEIRRLNPGIRFPPSESPIVRGDHSAATELFTGWLTATARSSLPKAWPGRTVNYPVQYVPQNNAIDGGDRVALALANPSSIGDNNDWTQGGYIGFIDASQAAYFGLPTARIQNGAGRFVAATPKSIRAAVSHARSSGGVVSPNFSSPNPNAYPMPVVDYVTAPTDLIDYHKGATLAKFLRYAVLDGQKAGNLPAGYVPLSAAMVAETTKISREIPDQKGEGKPPPRPKPSPSPTPSPTPSGGSGFGYTPGSGSGSVPSGGGAVTPSTNFPSPSTSSGSPAECIGASASCLRRVALQAEAYRGASARYLFPTLVLLGILALAAGVILELLSRTRGDVSLWGGIARAVSNIPRPRWPRR